MHVLLRLVFVTLTVGGGYAGFVATLPLLFHERASRVSYLLFVITFLCLYTFVVISGLFLVYDPKCKLPLLIAFALQIPSISSPIIAYSFTAGFYVTIAVIDGRAAGSFRLGSDWKLSVLQNAPWGIGVNLFAVAMLVLLVRTIELDRRTQKQSQPSQSE